jgi:hypothetical protein
MNRWAVAVLNARVTPYTYIQKRGADFRLILLLVTSLLK